MVLQFHVHERHSRRRRAVGQNSEKVVLLISTMLRWSPKCKCLSGRLNQTYSKRTNYTRIYVVINNNFYFYNSTSWWLFVSQNKLFFGHFVTKNFFFLVAKIRLFVVHTFATESRVQFLFINNTIVDNSAYRCAWKMKIVGAIMAYFCNWYIYNIL